MFLIYCTSVCICYHVAALAIPFDIQHDNVLKKLRRGGGSVGKYLLPCGYHVAAFVILFNLICNMTMF